MKLKNKYLTITCDGGAATGKSTGAKLVSKKYQLPFMSSGLLYRYASYLIIKHKPKNIYIFLRRKFNKLKYKKLFEYDLHTPEISSYSAKIAKKLFVRNILKKYQKNFIKNSKGCVLEGRDASTKILPNSDIKFFFICNLNTAAKRRYEELKNKSQKITFNEVRKAIKLRNFLDKNRKHSPLKKHKNAVVVNTGKLNKKAMLEKMSKHVENFLKQNGN